MADSPGWTPDSQILNSLVELLRSAQNPAAQKRVSSAIEELKSRSDGTFYLCYIFASKNLEEDVRQLAGLVLKNLSAGRYLEEWIGCKVLEQLCDPSAVIRSTSGSIITNILLTTGIAHWPEALTMLNKLVRNAPSLDVALSVLETYKKIVQDELEENMPHGRDYYPSHQLDNYFPGPSEAFVRISQQEFIPMLLELCNNDQVDKRLKLVCLDILELFNDFHIFACQEFGFQFFPAYWDCIGRVAVDPDFRLVVLKSFNTILEYDADSIISKASYIIPFFMECSNDADYNVRLEAIKFWPEFLKLAVNVKQLLEPYIPTLCSILVEHTRCSDIDLAEIDPAQLEDDNAAIPDLTNLVPRFHQGRNAAKTDEDDGEFTKSAWGSVWTVRKGAGLALDTISLYFGSSVLPVCLPSIERKLQTQQDLVVNGRTIPAWMERESGILILGAISKGCLSSLSSFIPNILTMLIKLSADAKPLLRSISCWCIARFSMWYCEPNQPQNLTLELPPMVHQLFNGTVVTAQSYLQQVIYALLVRMLDNNKCVQEAAASAIAVVFEEVGAKKAGVTQSAEKDAFNARNIVSMTLPAIYEVFGKCLAFYQSKNMTLLLDSISSLAQAIGSDMSEAQPNNVNEKLFVPLFEMFQTLSPTAYECSACCEAITNITTSIGQSILPLAPVILMKALDIIENHILTIKTHPQDTHSTDVIDACIDLLSYLLETAAYDAPDLLETTVAAPGGKNCLLRLLEILHVCICDDDLSVFSSLQQCIFAMLGDIAPITYHKVLAQILPQILPSIVAKLHHPSVPVSSNASWCLGQMVEQAPAGDPTIGNYVPLIVYNLGQLIMRDTQNHDLKQNAAITLGRFAEAYPAQVAEKLGTFLMGWCGTMNQYKGYTEKIKAYKGMMKACQLAPSIATAHANALRDCVAEFGAPGYSRGDPEVEQFIAELRQWFAALKNGR